MTLRNVSIELSKVSIQMKICITFLFHHEEEEAVNPLVAHL